AIAAIFGMLGHGTVDTVWYRPEVNTVWWLMVAMVASYWSPLTENRGEIRKEHIAYEL
ncbi:MAG: putative bicarbonate transporter, IctB family, partial [Cyanobacteriota bacterium]